MPLRIKEVAKSKGMTMAQIAEKLNISNITLSQSLNGNPTLSRLTEVAETLGVDVSELFVQPQKKQGIHGVLYVEGKPIIVNNREDIEMVLKTIKDSNL